MSGYKFVDKELIYEDLNQKLMELSKDAFFSGRSGDLTSRQLKIELIKEYSEVTDSYFCEALTRLHKDQKGVE